MNSFAASIPFAYPMARNDITPSIGLSQIQPTIRKLQTPRTTANTARLVEWKQAPDPFSVQASACWLRFCSIPRSGRARLCFMDPTAVPKRPCSPASTTGSPTIRSRRLLVTATRRHGPEFDPCQFAAVLPPGRPQTDPNRLSLQYRQVCADNSCLKFSNPFARRHA
jgi:hypothetical protein